MQEVTEKKETLALRVTKILNKEDRQHKKMWEVYDSMGRH